MISSKHINIPVCNMLTLLQIGTKAVEVLVSKVSSDAYSEIRKRIASFLKGNLSSPEAVDNAANNKSILTEAIIERASQDPSFRNALEQLITRSEEVIDTSSNSSVTTAVNQENMSGSSVIVGGSLDNSAFGDIVGGDKS